MIYNTVSFDDRFNLPLNGPGNYCVKNGIIQTRAVEVNPTRHCNISCKGCSHAAPLYSPCEYHTVDVGRDLCWMAKFIHSQTVRVVGGEPLIHENILDFLKTVKESGISDEICLVTNGLILHSFIQELAYYIDEIQISLYPEMGKKGDDIIDCARILKNAGIRVQILKYDYFRFPFCSNKAEDEKLVLEVYSTCQMAHYWRCITIDNGFVYRCPQSMVFVDVFRDLNNSVRIADISDVGQLLQFLENNEPLESCKRCFGSVGYLYPHSQISKDKWIDSLPDEYRKSIDFEYLKELKVNARTGTSCMSRTLL